MATYYVRTDGSNSNLGTSSGTGGAWQTIAKALGAAGIASADTVYIAPGTYREAITITMTSAVAETFVIGDVAASQFSDLAGGEVVWTNYTTNDTTANALAYTCDLNGRDFLTFEGITFITGGNVTNIRADTNTSTNITFRDCVLVNGDRASGSMCMFATAAADVALNWLVEKCILVSQRGGGILLQPVTPTVADLDINFIVRNCLVVAHASSNCVYLQPSGANAFDAGGLLVYNCTFNGANGVRTDTNTSTTIPSQVYNCVVHVVSTALQAQTSGQLVENFNEVQATTSHTNVSTGANTSVGIYAPRFDYGQSWKIGATSRPWLSPRPGSPYLGFGNDGTFTSSVDAADVPRPSGGESANKAIGYLEFANSFEKETGTVRTGSNAVSITGPGTQDFQLPVDAVSTTVTCYVRWDATYAGTKPQMKVLNCEEAGVTAASTTATGSSGAWEQVSLNFTPARAGIVTIRLQSNDTNGAGKMFADDFAVA
jgi:hypothetical protein